MKSDTCNHANEVVSFVITPLYSYFYPFLFYVPDEGCIPILFPFLGGIHHGVDFLAQFPSEFGQWVGDVVIIVSHEHLRIAANPLTHPCHSPHALKGQKLLAQGIRPGYSCPHAWRPERAKALYGAPNMIYKPKKNRRKDDVNGFFFVLLYAIKEMQDLWNLDS